MAAAGTARLYRLGVGRGARLPSGSGGLAIWAVPGRFEDRLDGVDLELVRGEVAEVIPAFGGGGLSLTPSVEVGLRRDGGDAETGAGMDVGGGLEFSDGADPLTDGCGRRAPRRA